MNVEVGRNSVVDEWKWKLEIGSGIRNWGRE